MRGGRGGGVGGIGRQAHLSWGTDRPTRWPAALHSGPSGGFSMLSRAHVVGLSVVAGLLAPIAAMGQMAYPPAPTVSQTDDYHGTKVADPYRWLEDYSPQTKAWIEAEGKLTSDYLEKIPERGAIRNRLT